MRLNIIHTNDLHGHLEHWPIIAEFIRRRRKLYQASDISHLILDIGDAMDFVHPLVEATQGQVMVDLFNEAGYDYVTIGNNEGLNFTPEELASQYARAQFKVIIANLLDIRTGQPPVWGQSYDIMDIEGVKVVIVGLTAPYQTYILNGYQILDPVEALSSTLDHLKSEKVDLIILLSHLGLEEDRRLADLFPDIGLIIGGHTHHVLPQGEWRCESLLAAAGKYGDFVGEITLEFDLQSHTWECAARLYDIPYLAELYDLAIEDKDVLKQGRDALQADEVATITGNYLALDLHTDESFVRLALDAITWYTQTDLAMLNSGLFLADIPQGQVTRAHLHEALPHPMHLAILTLKGHELFELLCEIEDQSEDLRYKLISGLGFRGKVFGEMVYKGLFYDYQAQEWYVHHQPLQFNATYQLVTVDHLWFLPFFPAIDKYGHPQLIFPDFLRHVVAKYLTYLETGQNAR